MSDPWIPDTVCETHEWRSPLGDVVRFVTRLEAEQRMMPPVALSTLRVPQAQGARFRSARHDERLLALPVVAPGAQRGRDELRRWAKALDPLHGEGTLTVVQGPWAGRMLVCAYEAGLDGLSEEYNDLELITLAFHAADPYWQDAAESQVIATIGQTGYHWFPFAGSWANQPLVLGSSDVFAVVTIDNVGDVDAWPVITVTGPGQDLLVQNQTTGLRISIPGAIAAGSTVAIDTRPGQKTVRIDGFNAFGRMTADSSLWPLIAGPNRVSIGFGNATTATAAAFAWRNRWLAA